MKKFKNIIRFIIVVCCVIAIAAVCYTYLGSGNWIKRFDAELDRFFGEGNWEYLSSETKESSMFDVHHSDYGTPPFSENTPGKYKKWSIRFTNRYGEDEEWEITNHAFKINHEKYGIFSSKRLSNKQAFVLELRDIALTAASEEVQKNIVEQVLPKEDASCINVEVSYHGGNPKPNFYNALWKEEWFQVNRVTAQNFLECDLHDFYIRISIYDYVYEKLSEEQQKNLLDNFDVIEKKLLEKYGENASFEMRFNDEYKVEYEKGKKVQR